MNSTNRHAPQTFREFDGLRGIAILLVMTHHFWPRAAAIQAELPHLGWIGVDLFFVLSGFLIAGILLDSKGSPGFFRNFYARRVIRIFPLYYTLVVASYVFIPLLERTDPGRFIAQSGPPWWYLLYLGNVREAITGHEPAYVLAPLWSLSIEEQFYALFPLLVATLEREQLRRVLLAMVAIAPLFRLATTLAWPENERIQYLATPSRMDVLAMGGLLAIAYREPAGWIGRRQLHVLFALSAVAFAATYALGGLDRTQFFGRVFGYSIVGGFFMAAVACALVHRESDKTAWLRWRPLMGLGKICYGVYLLQRPVEVVLVKTLGHIGQELPDDSLASMFIKMAATVIAATGSWLFFERPLLTLKQRFEYQPSRP